MFYSSCEWLNFTPIWNNRQNYISVNRKSPTFIHILFVKTITKSKSAIVEQQIYMLWVVFCFHCLKIVCENPYLWATGKTVVSTIKVHSCINSTKDNCHHLSHHMSKYPPFLWLLYKGWPKKLVLHKPLVTLTNLLKIIFVCFTVKWPYHSTCKLHITTIMM